MGYAKDLLMEAEGLCEYIKLYEAFNDLSCEFLDKYGEYLDPNTVTAIEVIQYEVGMIEDGCFVINHVQNPCLKKQLFDVMEEIEIFQAKGDPHEVDGG